MQAASSLQFAAEHAYEMIYWLMAIQGMPAAVFTSSTLGCSGKHNSSLYQPYAHQHACAITHPCRYACLNPFVQ